MVLNGKLVTICLEQNCLNCNKPFMTYCVEEEPIKSDDLRNALDLLVERHCLACKSLKRIRGYVDTMYDRDTHE